MTAVLDTVSRDQMMLKEIRRILSLRRIEFYRPYPKQFEFHRVGGEAGIRERLLMAANQVGKTWAAGSETSYHLTGNYPAWWDGVRFDGPTIGWTGSPTGQTSRDTVQRILLGRPGEWGTGAIANRDILNIKRSTHGVPDQVESILVRHCSGGQSTVVLKSYDQGRLRWQGETINFLWFDEEPPLDIYSEGLTRTNVTGGVVYMTFTPLLGMSDVVRRFMIEKVEGSIIISMTIEDAEHYTPEQRRLIIKAYPPHEREARAMGIPILGSGRIFPIEESLIAESAIQIPAHWPRIAGLDFGWDHPSAAAWMAWDRDTDTVHVYDSHRQREATPVIHAAAIKSRGPWIPVAWPHDGYQHDKGGSCEQLASQYRELGVNMLRDHATHPPALGELDGTGGYGVEAGLMMMLDRMQLGQLKVAKHLNDWWEEFRLYHRKDGKIVKVGDDLLSATRIGLMMLRKAKSKPADTGFYIGTRSQPPTGTMGRFGQR
jgi:phage terminase large subunit-like protein